MPHLAIVETDFKRLSEAVNKYRDAAAWTTVYGDESRFRAERNAVVEIALELVHQYGPSKKSPYKPVKFQRGSLTLIMVEMYVWKSSNLPFLERQRGRNYLPLRPVRSVRPQQLCLGFRFSR
jgi:hypothetical protein